MMKFSQIDSLIFQKRLVQKPDLCCDKGRKQAWSPWSDPAPDFPSDGINKDEELSQPVSPPRGIRREYGRSAGAPEGPSLGPRSRETGKPVCMEESGAVSPPGLRRVSSPVAAVAEEKLPNPLSSSGARRTSPSRSSSALSEYVEELRRQRMRDKEQGQLALGEASSSLPIYQTTGASSLRRCRTLQEEDDFPLQLDDLGGRAGAGLVRSSSLRSVSSESAAQAPLSPALKRVSKFGSYDSLVQSTAGASAKLSLPGLGGDALSTPRPRPWRSCLETSLEEEASEATELGGALLVFQSKRAADVLDEGKESDPFSWKIPTLSYERKASVDFDEFLPAIRKSQSTSSLSRGPKGRKDGQRPMSVHFEDQLPAKRSFLAKVKPQVDPGTLSDSSSSSSSGSVVSSKSADSVKSRPRVRRLEGEGCCVGKEASPEEDAADSRRAEAEGKEDDDVHSIMMKYLGKE